MSHPDSIVQTEFSTKLKLFQEWAISDLKVNLNKKEPHVNTEEKQSMHKTYTPKIGLNMNFTSTMINGFLEMCELSHHPSTSTQGYT